MEPNFKNAKMTHSTKVEISQLPITARAHGALIAFLFFILALLLAGLYFWINAERENPTITIPARPTYETNREPESTTAQAEVESLQVFSTSDEITAIEADLLSTDLTTLDKELVLIEQELNSIH